MTRGMYAAAGGMLVGLSRQDILASNLANANTPGFKLDRVSYGSFQRVMLPGVTDDNGQPASILQSATLNASQVDLRQGPLRETSGKLDLAVEGNGWFVVQGPQGERYTRNGHFARGTDGSLTTSQGLAVLGEGGPIILPSEDVTVDMAGRVFSRGQVVGQLRMVEMTSPETLTKDGDSLYGGGNPVPTTSSQVRQGWLEDSNTDTMRIMVEMMATMRGFETSQRIIQAQDQTLQQTIDTVRR
ncbi:MAG: flagellar basal-body rod protein FlgF [Armatimonadetes bacterium]|nr:flagellar basal-body rod protein FlgF [Armatimonadota bacterium]